MFVLYSCINRDLEHSRQTRDMGYHIDSGKNWSTELQCTVLLFDKCYDNALTTASMSAIISWQTGHNSTAHHRCVRLLPSDYISSHHRVTWPWPWPWPHFIQNCRCIHKTSDSIQTTII